VTVGYPKFGCTVHNENGYISNWSTHLIFQRMKLNLCGISDLSYVINC